MKARMWLLLAVILFVAHDFILHIIMFLNGSVPATNSGFPFQHDTLGYNIFWTAGWGTVLIILCVVFTLFFREQRNRKK